VDDRDSAIMILATRVSKQYRFRDPRQWLLQNLYQRLRGGRRPPGVVWALHDVSFSVSRGESLAIMGRNGAGKSTLVKILAGIAQPSSGRVETQGRISTQMALGAGFHPYLTGRENLFLQGTTLGLTNEEVRRRLPDIIAFAGLDGVLDRPLWTFSTGMTARLGFSVAVHVDFEVLLLDEALSAGDLAFQNRCQEALEGFRKDGKTLVVVSHGVESVRRLCDRALWLEDGSVRTLGPAEDVVRAYEQTADGWHLPK